MSIYYDILKDAIISNELENKDRVAGYLRYTIKTRDVYYPTGLLLRSIRSSWWGEPLGWHIDALVWVQRTVRLSIVTDILRLYSWRHRRRQLIWGTLRKSSALSFHTSNVAPTLFFEIWQGRVVVFSHLDQLWTIDRDAIVFGTIFLLGWVNYVHTCNRHHHVTVSQKRDRPNGP